MRKLCQRKFYKVGALKRAEAARALLFFPTGFKMNLKNCPQLERLDMDIPWGTKPNSSPRENLRERHTQHLHAVPKDLIRVLCNGWLK